MLPCLPLSLKLGFCGFHHHLPPQVCSLRVVSNEGGDWMFIGHYQVRGRTIIRVTAVEAGPVNYRWCVAPYPSLTPAREPLIG